MEKIVCQHRRDCGLILVTGKEAQRIAYALHALQPQVDGLRVQRLCLAQQ